MTPPASQVERAAQAAAARPSQPPLFPTGHEFARLQRASYSQICQALRDFDINRASTRPPTSRTPAAPSARTTARSWDRA